MFLTWHVDYWDRLGWKDPFASKEFTERQSRYKTARGQKQMWTPQFVADNEIVASGKAGTIPQLVAAAALRATSPVAITATATLARNKVAIGLHLTPAEQDWKPAKSVSLLYVLFRREAETDVPKGENEGRKLREFYVALATVASNDVAAALSEKGASASFDLPKGLAAADVGVAVLVEDAAGARTLQCAAVDVGADTAGGAKKR